MLGERPFSIVLKLSFIFLQATHLAFITVQATKQYRHMTKDHVIQILIEGCLKKDKTSQMALYKHFYSYGMGVCLRYSKNREEAMEILNDGFLKAFSKIDQYDPAYSFKPWLRRILINSSVDHYRKYHQKRDARMEEWHPNTSQSTYNEALDDLAYDDLIKVTQKLSPAYRMVFNLYVIEGMTHQEISEEINISIGASKSNLSKARKKLKSMLGFLNVII